MCGIVGAVSFEPGRFRITEPYLREMRDAMAHRGPDGTGLWIASDGRAGLGHRRLAIIDLSDAAAQPMGNEDGTLWITFNGEIYNHAAVRRQLEETGRHRWKTDHSDTEVILHAFEEWGIDCLRRFRGMFAFGLWDARAQELWLVRDRIGIKPLYYSARGDRLVFASEIKALLQDPTQPRAVDPEAFYHYLSFLTAPAPSTLFRGIRKLAGGCWLRVRGDGRIDEQRWWDVWDHTAPLTDASDDAIAGRVLDELRTAVRLHKVSDVPVGVFLSGGIDSSANAALFSERSGEPVRTFTIGYEGDYRSYRNELVHARRMAALVGADHRERLLTLADLLAFLPEMIRLQDEPIADPVCVPVYYVSKLARDHGVTVCQVGEGSDELFMGYPAWHTARRLQRYDALPVPGIVKQAALAGLRASGRQASWPYEWLRRGAHAQPIFWGGAEAFTERQKRALLAPALRRQFDGLTSWEAIRPIHQRFLDGAWETSPLHWMTYLDLNLRLPELLLMRVDKMSMAVSLEARVPFLDHVFVELALSIPERVKMRGGDPKYVLKKAVRGVIPDDLIHRPKQGFGVPISEWFFQGLGALMRRELAEFCGRTEFLDWPSVARFLDEGQGPQAWYLLNFALWWKEYIA